MAYSSYSGPLKNPFNDLNNDDDEFGDFTSAVTFSATGNHMSENNIQINLPICGLDKLSNNPMPTNSVFFNPIPESEIDEEFGDFCGPIVTQSADLSLVVPPSLNSDSNLTTKEYPATEDSVKPSYKPNYDIDLERDLTAVPQLSWTSLGNTDEHTDDEFTNFTSAEPVHSDLLSSDFPTTESNTILSPNIPDLLSSQPTTEEDLFSVQDQDNLPSLQAAIVTDPQVDDDFGDFTQAVVSPPVVAEDLFSLNTGLNEQPAILPDFTLDSTASAAAPYDCFKEVEEVDVTSEKSIETPHVDWDEPLKSIDISELPRLPCETIKPDEDIDEAPQIQNESNEDCLLDEIPEVKLDSEPNMEVAPSTENEPAFDAFAQEDTDEFGDFTDFQVASEPAEMASEDDDEFDDFEAAPPSSSAPTLECPPVESATTTPENQIHRVLMTLFPVNTPNVEQQTAIPQTTSPGGTLWSYISQLDSTPALSFSWRHSAAQQRFLHSLRIDTVLPGGNAAYRWSSPASVNSSSSVSESFTEPSVALDLDFFLNPTTTTSTSALPATPTNTTDSILETFERELLSPGNNKGLSPISTQSPAPVRHNNPLSGIFDHLHIDTNASVPPVVSSRPGVVDLLQ